MTGCSTARTVRGIRTRYIRAPAAFGQRCFWCRWPSRFDASRTRRRWLRRRLLSLYSRSRRSNCAGPKDGGLPTRRGAPACGITTVSMINICGPDLALAPLLGDDHWIPPGTDILKEPAVRRALDERQHRGNAAYCPPAPMRRARTQSSIMEDWPAVTVTKPAGAQSSRSWLTARSRSKSFVVDPPTATALRT